jgi:HSP20 family molecular chaperone IbpA
MSTDDFHVQADQVDEKITVIADLPGVSIDDLAVGFTSDPTDFIIKVENIYGARVPLPWESVDHSTPRLNNGIFTVQIYPSEMDTKQGEQSTLDIYR